MTRRAASATGLIEVRCTAPDDATAQRLARLLVEERLAACTQVVPGLTSTYRWAGEVRTDAECLLLAKTDERSFARLRERLRAEHPYEVPEILAIPVLAADAEYAAWVREEVAG